MYGYKLPSIYLYEFINKFYSLFMCVIPAKICIQTQFYIYLLPGIHNPTNTAVRRSIKCESLLEKIRNEPDFVKLSKKGIHNMYLGHVMKVRGILCCNSYYKKKTDV